MLTTPTAAHSSRCGWRMTTPMIRDQYKYKSKKKLGNKILGNSKRFNSWPLTKNSMPPIQNHVSNLVNCRNILNVLTGYQHKTGRIKKTPLANDMSWTAVHFFMKVNKEISVLEKNVTFSISNWYHKQIEQSVRSIPMYWHSSARMTLTNCMMVFWFRLQRPHPIVDTVKTSNQSLLR